ncbi:hypothetical protein GAYE_SCF38G5238 [Galdieria yellowstonensis]|uniref:Uncharacterized protein n=1 Tax=Galdieria yellowstonensis TaxID=3028027 RepID=A0AAV9IJ85_9RHOD|nr:hypothetical protein GAYE_SCF38G5238 [Galdieria yellowstonensis]
MQDKHLESSLEVLSSQLPRVAIVSRRHIRKNKFVDFVGEYHLDLIVKNGAVPLIVPRVQRVHEMLESFEPIHGVLLCEGEDIDPSLYQADLSNLDPEVIEKIKEKHSGDTKVDKEKDSIEFALCRRCIAKGIPFLGICRGSQIMNVALGGTLYFDVELQLKSSVKHIDYDNYDGHRHPVTIVPGTPLYEWFGQEEILVNSYHHQGIKDLGRLLSPMAFAPDGLIEGYYCPSTYNPKQGNFLVGLQFHPERMQESHITDSSPRKEVQYDYPGCPKVYETFIAAVQAFASKQRGDSGPSTKTVSSTVKNEYRMVVESFNEAARVYHDKLALDEQTMKKFQVGMKFLETQLPLSVDDLNRLSRIGATVRGGNIYQTSGGKSKAPPDRVREESPSKLMDSLQHVMKVLPSLSPVEIEQLAASLEQALAAVVEYRNRNNLD